MRSRSTAWRRRDLAPEVTKLLVLCHGVNIALPKCVWVVTPRAVQEASVAEPRRSRGQDRTGGDAARPMMVTRAPAASGGPAWPHDAHMPPRSVPLLPAPLKQPRRLRR